MCQIFICHSDLSLFRIMSDRTKRKRKAPATWPADQTAPTVRAQTALASALVPPAQVLTAAYAPIAQTQTPSTKAMVAAVTPAVIADNLKTLINMGVIKPTGPTADTDNQEVMNCNANLVEPLVPAIKGRQAPTPPTWVG